MLIIHGPAKASTSTAATTFGTKDSVASLICVAAWKMLTAESAPNVYILEGGVNNWLATFAPADPTLQRVAATGQDRLGYTFRAALGARSPAATPDPHTFKLEYMPKIQLKLKRGPTGGGCG